MDGLKKFDPKDLRGKETILWCILLLNLLSVILNAFSGGLFFVFFNGAAVIWMAYIINHYYLHER